MPLFFLLEYTAIIVLPVKRNSLFIRLNNYFLFYHKKHISTTIIIVYSCALSASTISTVLTFKDSTAVTDIERIKVPVTVYRYDGAYITAA